MINAETTTTVIVVNKINIFFMQSKVSIFIQKFGLMNRYLLLCLFSFSSLFSFAQEPDEIAKYVNSVSDYFNKVPQGMINFSISINTGVAKAEVVKQRDEMFKIIDEAKINIAGIKEIPESLGYRDSVLSTLSAYKAILSAEFLKDNFLDSMMYMPKDILAQFDHGDSISVALDNAYSIQHKVYRKYINHHKLRQQRSGVHALISRYSKMCDYYFDSQRKYLLVWMKFEELTKSWNTRNSDSLSSRSKIFNAFVEKQKGEINGMPLYKNDSTLLIQNDSVFNKMIEFNNEYVPVILEEFAFGDWIPDTKAAEYKVVQEKVGEGIALCDKFLHPQFVQFYMNCHAYFTKHLN